MIQLDDATHRRPKGSGINNTAACRAACAERQKGTGVIVTESPITSSPDRASRLRSGGMSTRSRCRLVQPPRGTISVTDGDVAVLGFNSDGTLDTSFDSDGRSIFNLVGARYNPDGTPVSTSP